MRTLFRKFASSKAATAGIEFAFIAPVMVVMLAAIVEIGRLYQVYTTVNRVATQLAITWSDCSDVPTGACNTERTSLTSSNLLANLVPQLQASSLTVNLSQVTMNGSTPTVVYPSGGSLTASETTAAQGVLTTGQSGVVVTASYVHSLQYFPTLMSPYLSSLLNSSFTAVQLKN